MVIKRIRKVVLRGAVIPKPGAREEFRIKGNGTRRCEDAIIYTIPNHFDPTRP